MARECGGDASTGRRPRSLRAACYPDARPALEVAQKKGTVPANWMAFK